MQCITIKDNNVGKKEVTLTGQQVFAFMKAERSITLNSILTQTPVLKQQLKENPKDIQKAIVVIIKQYTEQLNTYKEISSIQLTAIALDLSERFENDTLEDIIMLFKYARQGRFGYHARFDVSVVSQWIPEYMEIKAEAREKMMVDQQGRALKGEITDESLKKFYQKQIQNKEVKRVLNKKRSIKIPPNSPLANSTQLQRTIVDTVGALTEKELKKNIVETQVSNPDLAKIFKEELKGRKSNKKH